MSIDDFHDFNGDEYFGRLASWVPPPSLTIEKLQRLEGVRLQLTEVLCLMTFGDPKSVELPNKIFDDDFHLFRPAYKKLFEAGRLGKVKFFGSRRRFGTPSEELSVAEFAIQRMADHRYKSIDPDLFGVGSMDEYKAARDEVLNQVWWYIYIDTASFVGWLKGELGIAGVPSGSSGDDFANEANDDAAHAGGMPLTKLQNKILRKADELWPDGQYPNFVKDRDNAIINAWPNGQKPPHTKTIQRAFKTRTNEDK